MTDKTYDVIIIGGGPAGLTAGIYASRARADCILLEKSMVGGQVLFTDTIENFPGFPDSIGGPELIANMRKQAEKFGTEFIMKNVTAVNFKEYPFRIMAEESEFIAEAVIIATGAQARYLNVPSVEAFKGRGISACATCDGFFFRDGIIYVIGGGDTAAEEALHLARFGKEVHIVHRRDELRAEKYMQEKHRHWLVKYYMINWLYTNDKLFQ